MSIDFSTIQGITIPEGVVTQIADSSGRVLWSAMPLLTVTSTFEGMWGGSAEITVTSETPFAPDPSNPDDKVTSWTVTSDELPNCSFRIVRGSTVECFVTRDKSNLESFIKLNDETVVSGEGTYTYTVTGDVTIDVSVYYKSGDYGQITITET